MEQLVGIRKTWVTVRPGLARYQVGTVKAILVRRDFFLYLKTRFPKMSHLVENYLAQGWYQQAFPNAEFDLSAFTASVDNDADFERPTPQTADDTFLSTYFRHRLLKNPASA